MLELKTVFAWLSQNFFNIILMEKKFIQEYQLFFYQDITFSLSLIRKDELNSSQVSLSEYLDIALFMKYSSPEYRKR